MCPLKEIPPVNIIAAPGAQAANAQLGLQRVNVMAGRGRNNNQALQGADPALVQILQMMQNRDANRDNSRKQFLMFPKYSSHLQNRIKRKLKAIGLSFLNILTIKINKVLSHDN